MPSSTSKWDTIAIIGVGLIGGSIGLAAKTLAVAKRVIGIGRNPERLRTAIECGAIDQAVTEVRLGVAAADLVVICTPVDSIVPYAKDVLSHCAQATIVTDAGSTKRTIVESMAATGRGQFIGSHPLAGSENTGVSHARADLFKDRVVVVTPTEENPREVVSRLEGFWRSLGAHVTSMAPAAHDEALARTSHLPHVAAAALANATPVELAEFVATGWLDTTRVAAGAVDLWQQILLDNRSEVLKSIDSFAECIQLFREAIAENSTTKLVRLLEQGKQRRDALGS